MLQSGTVRNSALEKQVRLINDTDEVLTWKWDGELYAFQPHCEESTTYWFATHMIKHLGAHGLKMEENEHVTCGICAKQFDTRRELGAHSLVHKKDR